MSESTLNNNTLAFIALSNEFCAAAENARQSERRQFMATMLRLLPRIYISASDLAVKPDENGDAYLASCLDEDYYESIRRNIEMLMGPDDTYLEVFEEDMKYSDTPLAASIAENIADIFQSLYNFLETVRDATPESAGAAITAIKEDFDAYWSKTLCNVMRPLNAIYRSPDNYEE